MASASVVVATTISVMGRVIDERGTPLVNVMVVGDPAAGTMITRDDGSFLQPISGVVPPYTICLYAPTTCYVGVTRADPTLVVWRNSSEPPTSYTMSGAIRRVDSTPLPPLGVLVALDGPGAAARTVTMPDTYATGMVTAPRVAVLPARAWAVLQDGTTAEFGQTSEVALIAGGTVTGQDITLSPVPSRSITASYSGQFPPLQLFLIWGLVLPHGGVMELGGQSAPELRVLVVAGAKMFVQAAAFAPQSARKLSAITAVTDTLDAAVSLAIPPVPVITSPPAGGKLTPTTQLVWTPLAGAVYRVHYTDAGSLDLVIAAPATTFPELPLALKALSADCSAFACSVAIETYGGLPTTDAATDGTALLDVKRGARSGSFAAGALTKFSN